MNRESEEKKVIKQVNKLLTKKNFQEIIVLINNFLEKNETTNEIQRLLSLAYINIEENEKAIDSLELAIKLDHDDATSHFYLATLYDNKEMPEEAITEYLKVIELREDYLDVYKNLAVLYIKLSEIDKAQLYGNKAFSLSDGKDYQIYYILSTIAMIKHDYKKVIELLEKGLEHNATHIQMINNLGSAYLALNDIKKATEYYEKALVLDENNALTNYNIASIYQIYGKHEEAYNHFEKVYKTEASTTNLSVLGFAAIRAKKWKEAIKIYSTLVTLKPENINYQHNLATAYTESGDYEKAIFILESIFKINKTSVSVIEKLVDLYVITNQTEKVKDFLSRILKRGKVSPNIYYNYAMICAKTNDIDKAIAILKKVSLLEPENPLPHKDLGVIYLSQNLFDYAKDEFKTAINLAPENVDILFEYANFYHKIQNYSEAEKIYLSAIKLNPENFNIKLYLGLNYLQQNDFQNAKIYLEDVYKVVPTEQIVAFSLARIFFAEQKYESAKQVLYALDSFNSNDEIINLLAICHLELKEYQDSKEIFKNLLKKNEGNINILYNLAKCEIALGQNDAALNYLNDAVELFPDFEEAHELIRQIS